MTTVQASGVAGRFLDALSQRDFEALAATFTENSVLRGLVPTALREAEGRDAIVERFRIWFGDTGDFELVDSSADDLADLVRIRWRVVGEDPETGRIVTEQTAYAAVEDGGIAWMNLVCSGHRPLAIE